MASTTELRKSYLDTAKTLSTKPLYAWAGAGDLAVEKLREVPQKVRELRSEVTVEKLKSVPAAIKEDVTEAPGKISAKVNALPKTPKALTNKLTEVTEAQVKAVDARFDALADRGESVVKRIRSQKATTDLIDQAKTTVTAARNTAAKATGTTKTGTTKAGTTKAGTTKPAAAKPATTRTGTTKVGG